MIFLHPKGFSKWIKKDPVKASITVFVSLFHVSFILMLCFYPLMHKKKPQQKLVVKTFQAPKTALQEKKKPIMPTKSSTSSAMKTPSIAKAPPEKKKPAVQAPQPKAAAPPAKKQPPTAKPVAKAKPAAPPAKTTPNKSATTKSTSKSSSKNLHVPQELIDELEERIAKIETKRDKIQSKADITIPKSIDSSFSKETHEYFQEDDAIDELSDYSDFLVAYLQQHLHLPDFGEVKVEVTLSPNGTVEKYVVLKTESDKNRKYLEERLPSLRFPEFKGKGSSQSRKTFVLTFCNEI